VVSNIGGTAGNYNVVLKVNGVVQMKKLLRLIPVLPQLWNLPLTENIANSYNLDVNGQSVSIHCTVPASNHIYADDASPNYYYSAYPNLNSGNNSSNNFRCRTTVRLALLGVVIGIPLFLIIGLRR